MRGWVKRLRAKRKPSPSRLRHPRGPFDEAAHVLAADVRHQPRFDVGRDQRHRRADHQQQARDRGGDDRQLDRARSVQDAGPQQQAEDDQRERIEGVVEADEGDHPAGHVAAVHPRFAQRPVGERDAARAARREEQRRGDARHVDLVGLAPAQLQRIAADHRFEERDVGGVGGDREDDRDPDPDRVGIVQLGDPVADPDQLREEEVDPDQQERRRRCRSAAAAWWRRSADQAAAGFAVVSLAGHLRRGR